MSGKLDKALDEIISTQRTRAGGRTKRPVRRATGRPATIAPIGGIQKHAKPARANAAKPTLGNKPAGKVGESKILVSNLPKDVKENQIKVYFNETVGHVKRVELSYGPNGLSRGIANVIFSTGHCASEAFNKLNGLLVDGKPIKVEVLIANADLIPQPKTLGQRVTQPKAQPKSAAAGKGPVGKGPAADKGPKQQKKRGKSSRPAKKTQEELDSEMADYFESAPNANGENGNSTAPAVGTGDAPMEDEIM